MAGEGKCGAQGVVPQRGWQLVRAASWLAASQSRVHAGSDVVPARHGCAPQFGASSTA